MFLRIRTVGCIAVDAVFAVGSGGNFVKIDRAARTADLIRGASHRMPTGARKLRGISQPIRTFVARRVAAVSGPCRECVTESERMCAAQERWKITYYTGAGEKLGITATDKKQLRGNTDRKKGPTAARQTTSQRTSRKGFKVSGS